MDAELMTLGFLMSGPKTGYRMQNIAGRLTLNYNLSFNQIYPVLRKLEGAGFVEKETVIQTGRPNKNVYSLTRAGRDYFRKRITGPGKPFDYNLDFLVRVLFFRFLDNEAIVSEFEKEIRSLQEQIDTLEAMAEKVRGKADQDGAFSYRTAIHLLRTLRDWYAEEMQRRREQYFQRHDLGKEHTHGD